MPIIKEATGYTPRTLVSSRQAAVWIVAAFSAFYFSDVALRASEKFFWYDELFTVYFARLGSVHALWAALTNGIDFNPPLFYWLTMAANSLFGEGQIVTRLPEILGFWIFSVCLFRFVQRRAGNLAGLSAMLFPMVTEVYYYAYEARPHGAVLGFCGLALVCWQKASEGGPARRGWLAGFAAALLGAFMMHCFALTLLAPFCLIELLCTFRRKRLDWEVWLAFAAPTVLAGSLYVALLRSFRKLSNQTNFSDLAVPGFQQVVHFYQFLLDPALVIVFALLVIFAAEVLLQQPREQPQESRSIPAVTEDFLLGLAFLTIPVFGVVLARLVHGPAFHRYFLSAIAGISVVVGMGTGLRKRHNWLPAAVALVLASAVLVNFGRVVDKRMHGQGETLFEPSLHRPLDTTPGRPLDQHSLLTSNHSDLPIAVLSNLDFVYLLQYAPLLRDRLYFVPPSTTDFAFSALERFRECCGLSFNRPVVYDEFARQHADFLVYGDAGNAEQLMQLNQSHDRIESLRAFRNHFLAHLSK